MPLLAKWSQTWLISFDRGLEPMTAKIEIPSALQAFTDNQKVVEVPEGTLEDVLNSLFAKYSQLREQLYDDKGRVRSFVNVFVNDEDVRYAQNLKTPVKGGDVVHIIPSIAGG
jgi:molybdopterin converting factor small subunit